MVADRLSQRLQTINSEWTLSQQILHHVWRLWGQPHVDLFATSETAHLPTYVSPLPDPAAWRTDALSFPWMDLWAYMFPPFPLIPEVLQRIQASNCHAILVAPAWPSQPWFPRLLSLLDDHPETPTSAADATAPASVPGLSPRPVTPLSTCLEAVKSALISRGYSSMVATCIAASHCLSTQSVYDSKWRIFTEWCRGTGHDPFSTSTPVLADFLAFLFTAKGFAPTTIAGYCTTIINMLEKVTGHRLADEHLISSLLNQFESERPRLGRSTPDWDLALVLRALHYAPFEPLTKVPPLGADLQDGLPDSSCLSQASVGTSCLLLPSSTP